jgi:Spy/CpxP family protein refolding chaperone
MPEMKLFYGFEKKAYVTEDGNYGSDIIIIFEQNDLTEHQWDQLGEINDNSRLEYVQKILNGEDASDMEE